MIPGNARIVRDREGRMPDSFNATLIRADSHQLSRMGMEVKREAV
jgi:hypothetical protein